jgi:hypothetical protein
VRNHDGGCVSAQRRRRTSESKKLNAFLIFWESVPVPVVICAIIMYSKGTNTGLWYCYVVRQKPIQHLIYLPVPVCNWNQGRTVFCAWLSRKFSRCCHI